MVASDDQVKICVIDLRLGKHEENPEEQLLGAWSYRQQTESAMMDIVRLARGSIGLCSHFQTVRCFVNQLMYAGPQQDQCTGIDSSECWYRTSTVRQSRQ